jgi:YHS domain-containing protein
MKAAKTIERTVEQAAIDPVCGMNVPPNKRGLVANYKGAMHHFCAESCRTAFIKDPEKYLGAKSAKKKGWLGRRLERMAKSNKEQFGGGRPSCCD